ncbi:MAG: Rpn family recombination-promoting nuclease/putative transposase, partial [Clostridiales bacterium]|nr:Rpn family recombination-promoting nuclease/putative transposase [Clostridiales bacterium]
MTKLEFKFTNDTLFKMVFVKHPDLLKRLVALLLGIAFESITEFVITNPEMPPEALKEKFCRLDINMRVNGKRVNLEIQVVNEHDYPERSLYYWAREYSSALVKKQPYSELPEVIVISIIDFPLFDCGEYFSRYQILETNRHTLLTPKLDMRYYELGKLPEILDSEDEEQLMLAVFKAKTEEELSRLDEMEAPIVKQAIKAYRQVVVLPEFRELERLRSDARHNEASALLNAKRIGYQDAAEDFRGVITEREATIANQV